MNCLRACEPARRLVGGHACPTSCCVALLTLLEVSLDSFHDGGVCQGGGVADRAVFGDVLKQTAHNLAGAGLGQAVHNLDVLEVGYRTDIIAHAGFKFVATMNPGGDFGKKELSPALRNRFTEIWVPSVMSHDELSEIVKDSWAHDELARFTEPMLGFVEWLLSKVKDSTLVTLRDILVRKIPCLFFIHSST